jgi:hypothetical protein
MAVVEILDAYVLKLSQCYLNKKPFSRKNAGAKKRYRREK